MTSLDESNNFSPLSNCQTSIYVVQGTAYLKLYSKKKSYRFINSARPTYAGLTRPHSSSRLFPITFVTSENAFICGCRMQLLYFGMNKCAQKEAHDSGLCYL